MMKSTFNSVGYNAVATIQVYLHSFSCCWLRHLRNPTRNSEKIQLITVHFKVIQSRRSWCQSKAHIM